MVDRRDLLKIPVDHVSVKNIETIGDLIESFNYTSFQSRKLAQCLNVLKNIISDPDRPIVFLGLAGAMVPGGMRRIIRDMIEDGIVDVLVSTGANLYHDIHEALGKRHYVGKEHVDDDFLRSIRIVRIYDTYADDHELFETDYFIKEFIDSLEPRPYSSREFLYLLGGILKDENSILATASKYSVPVYSPALNDSSIGIAFTKYLHERLKNGKPFATIDPIMDNYEILQIKVKAKKTAAIYIGGGVPKNYIQQLEVLAEVVGFNVNGHYYNIQITTDDPKWGGLSGSTFEEARSWGKVAKHARRSAVYIDATIGLPILYAALRSKYSEQLSKRSRVKFRWENHTLEDIENI